LSSKLDEMKKDIIKLLIAEYQQRVGNVVFQNRPIFLEDKLNYVFVGLRRAGKSYLMYQQIHNLVEQGHSKDEILFFNFEDDRLIDLETYDLDLIKVCYEEMFDFRPIFFLDEIQNVKNWEKFVRRLADQGYRVYVTGSNAKMLSSEIATTLGGRFLIQYVFPYSFPEFLISQGIEIKEPNALYIHQNLINKAFQTYFQYGGFPELTQVFDKRTWLSNLYQKIFFGDLISRYQIRNDFALRVLVRKLAESVKQPTSFNRLANVVSASGKKISTDTVIDYIQYLKETWLILPLENISAKLSDKESNKKYYFSDNGVLNLFLIDPVTSLLENLVAIQLMKMYPDDVYFYQKGIEVDFYVQSSKLAIQICYSMIDVETRNREINALLKLSQHLEVERMMIITKEEEEIIVVSKNEIEIVPVWKWLLTSL